MRLFYLLFLLLPTFAYSQENLTVVVRSLASNQPASGVEVNLVNPSRGFLQKALTDNQGRAVFPSIPAVDGYLLTILETETWFAAESDAFDVRNNQSRTIDLYLTAKTTVDLDEIVVTGASTTRINRMDAEVSFELGKKELQALPIEGRDITRVLFRLPNVSQATGFYPEAPNVSINGANSLFTSYLIDGLDNNERFLGGQKFALPSGFVRNITVLTNNYSAEYGLTANGVVNLTTPSGANDLSGEAYVISRPGPVIDGASDFAQRDLSGNLVKDGFQRYQAGFALGGALKPDKTFFYFNLEHTTDFKENRLSSPDLGVNEVVRGANQFTYLSGRVDHNWSQKFRSTLRANLGRVEIERQGGGLEGGVTFPSAGNFQDRNSFLLASQNTYVSGNFSSQTNIQYARFRWNYGRGLNPEGPQVTLRNPSAQVIAVLGHPGYFFDQTENTIQVLQKFNFYLNRHTLKAGLGAISADHQLFGGGNPDGNYDVLLTQQQLDALNSAGLGSNIGVEDVPQDVQVLAYNAELRPAAFGARQTVYSAYIEDQWSAANRLNLTLGLRYDYDDLSRGGAQTGDLNNLAPRFNFNYQLSTTSALRGGYGIFYDKIPYAIYSDALQQNTTSPDYRAQLAELIRLGILPADTDLEAITFDGNLTASASGIPYLQGPTPEDLAGQRDDIFSNERRILNPNGYQNPYTHQFTLGYQWQLEENSLFFVDLVHNQSYNLFRLRNLNAAAPYPIDPDNVVVRTPAEADLSRPIPIYEGSYAVVGGDTLNGIARNIVVSETEGRSRYYAASFNLQQERGERRYAYRLNYTLSLLENNTEDINFRAMDANDFESEWGPSINDRTHILSGIFTYYPLPNLTVSAAALLQSGQPINRIPDGEKYGTTDLNGDGASFGDAYVGNSDRQPGETRNNDRLPWSNVFDLAIQYEIPLGGSAMAIRADVFNVFNAQNLSGYSNFATQSNQIQAGPRSSGLLVRRNAGPPRQFQFGLHWFF